MAARFVKVPVELLFPRPARPDEIRHVRQTWWNHARLGRRLPAERGVILINGGRR